MRHQFGRCESATAAMPRHTLVVGRVLRAMCEARSRPVRIVQHVVLTGPVDSGTPWQVGPAREWIQRPPWQHRDLPMLPDIGLSIMSPDRAVDLWCRDTVVLLTPVRRQCHHTEKTPWRSRSAYRSRRRLPARDTGVAHDDGAPAGRRYRLGVAVQADSSDRDPPVS